MRPQQCFTYEKNNDAFINWLAEMMTPCGSDSTISKKKSHEHSSFIRSPLHQYTLPKRNLDYIHFPPRGLVTISSLWQAAKIYRWRGDNLQVTAENLARLTNQIRASYPGKASDCVKAAEEVLRWGGVYMYNGPWAVANQQRLLNSMRTVAELHTNATWPMRKALPAARMNSGFTKIYALQLPGFLIYDSRVAAALALLTLIYAVRHNGRMPPIAQDLRVMAGRSRQRTVRGIKPRGGEADHLRANLAANWLIERVFTKHPELRADWRTHTVDVDEYRALEAALFMLGYDIGTHPALGDSRAGATENIDGAAKDTGPRKRSAKVVRQTTSFIPLRTFSRGVDFKVCPTILGYQLHFGGSSGNATFSLATLQSLALDFAGKRVAIGASRTSPPEGSLGEYLQKNVSKTALSSYVAPLLVYLGLANRDGDYHLVF